MYLAESLPCTTRRAPAVLRWRPLSLSWLLSPRLFGSGEAAPAPAPANVKTPPSSVPDVSTRPK
eukprot:6201598-Pleurochrysis_carterae.AAC.1